jgi:hypothetical protein
MDEMLDRASKLAYEIIRLVDVDLRLLWIAKQDSGGWGIPFESEYINDAYVHVTEDDLRGDLSEVAKRCAERLMDCEVNSTQHYRLRVFQIEDAIAAKLDEAAEINGRLRYMRGLRDTWLGKMAEADDVT